MYHVFYTLLFYTNLMIDKLKKKNYSGKGIINYWRVIYTLYVNQDTFVILYTAFPKIGAASLIQYAKNKNNKNPHYKPIVGIFFAHSAEIKF